MTVKSWLDKLKTESFLKDLLKILEKIKNFKEAGRKLFKDPKISINALLSANKRQ